MCVYKRNTLYKQHRHTNVYILFSFKSDEWIIIKNPYFSILFFSDKNDLTHTPL